MYRVNANTESINCTVEGEILKAEVKPDVRNFPYMSYTCKIFLPNGQSTIITNVVDSSQYGGIGDYQQRRARARNDAEFPGGIVNPDQEENSVGERVYIIFVNGSLKHPVIIAYKQHPIQIREFDNDNSVPDIGYIDQYMGIRKSISTNGDYRLFHLGAPETNYVDPSASNPLALFTGNDNTSLVPASTGNFSAIEMLAGGFTRIRNSSGNQIIFSSDLTLQNNSGSNNIDLFSLDAAEEDEDADVDSIIDANTSEKIVISNERKSIEITTRDLFELISNEEIAITSNDSLYVDATGEVAFTFLANWEVSIGGDYTENLAGSFLRNTVGTYDNIAKGNISHVSVDGTISLISKSNMTLISQENIDITVLGDRNANITGADNYFLAGEWKVEAVQGIELGVSAGAKLKIDAAGLIGLGGPGGELLDLFDRTLYQLNTLLTDITNPANQPTGNLGFPTVVSPGLTAAAIAIQTQVTAIKTELLTFKGGI